MLLLGVDVGTSSIKISVFDAEYKSIVVAVQYPEEETTIISKKLGWAEQSPDNWWLNVQQGIVKANATGKYNPNEIAAIGIAYQMHGLVIVDKEQQVLRDSIIWCDSRAVDIGQKAFEEIGEDWCLSHLLNSPGNFTAAKLAWVKDNEPGIYQKIDKAMLPGDFIAMRFSGNITTTISALSEGIFWDFKNNRISEEVLNYFGFDASLFPEVKPVFYEHGYLKEEIAKELGLKAGIPITYKAGDQQNNALSLNVLKPGEVAATAGTSGVIFAVSDSLSFDPLSRINTFAHVNHTTKENNLGVLLCINGTGILNRWAKDMIGSNLSYTEINELASSIQPGANGLLILPFGNGAERMLQNVDLGAQFHHLNLNFHTKGHIFRAVQESIAFSFRYGLDILRENGIYPKVIKAGKANLFLSDVFTDIFVKITQTPVELYELDGSSGAAIGAGIGCGAFVSSEDAFSNLSAVKVIHPTSADSYEPVYQNWKKLLLKALENN